MRSATECNVKCRRSSWLAKRSHPNFIFYPCAPICMILYTGITCCIIYPVFAIVHEPDLCRIIILSSDYFKTEIVAIHILWNIIIWYYMDEPSRRRRRRLYDKSSRWRKIFFCFYFSLVYSCAQISNDALQ
jgi:hypothetical protein